MNAIKQLDKQNLKNLEAEIINALNSNPTIAAAGVTFRFAGGSYVPNQATLKLVISVPTADGESPEALFFKTHAHLYGLHPNCLNKVFRDFRGDRFKLVGMRDCRSKFKFAAIHQGNGKTLYFTTPSMLNAKWEEAIHS